MAAAVDPPALGSPSDVHSVEVIEYGEIEEEIEVEEEYEEGGGGGKEKEEDDGDDMDLGEDPTPINHIMKHKEPPSVEELVGPNSTTPGKSVVNLPSDAGDNKVNFGICRILDSNEARHNEESQSNGKVTPRYHGITGEIDSRSFGTEDEAISDIGGSSKEANDELRIEEKTYHVPGEYSRIRPRSSTPELEFNNGSSKRPATLCKFYAKGWCIKGNSCRFLHIMDQIGISSQAEREISDIVQKKGEFQVVEVTSSIQLTEHSGEKHGEKSRVESLLPLRKCDRLEPLLPDSKRDLNMEDRQGNSVLMARDGSFRGASSNGCSRLSENNENTRNAHLATCSEEMTCGSRNLLTSNQNLPVSVSSLYRSPLSFSYPWNGDPLSSKKLLDNDLEHHASQSASVRRSSSPHSRPESENLSRTNPFCDKQSSVRSIVNIPYNWEPSVPFRPFYPLTKSLLLNISSRSLYEPIHDSIEVIKSGEDASALRAHKEGNTDTFATGTLGTECSSNRTLGAEWKDKKSLLKEELLGSDHIKDFIEDKNSADCDSKMESGGQSQYRSQGKEERSKQILEADADLKVEESRALKNFHATLVEVVKELLRPSWHGGLISKDAHKVIVKKSVEKVLSSIPPHQVPNTPELVKQYMSASQEKLTKLVVGYVDKYRKS